MNNKYIARILSPGPFLVFAIIHCTFCYSVTFPNWYFGGFIMLLTPIYGLLTILYQGFIEKRKQAKTFLILSIIYFAYIYIIHMLHGDFTIHGVGDIVTSFFLFTMLLSLNKDELINILRTASLTLLWLSIIYALLSLITTYILAPEHVASLKEGSFLRLTTQRWLKSDATRMNGIGGNSNSTGHWCSYSFMFGTFYLVLKKTNLKDILLHVTAFTLTTIILIKTASRAALLSLTVFLILFFICFILNSRKSPTEGLTKKYVYACLIILVISIALFSIVMLTNKTVAFKLMDILRISHTEDMTLNEVIANTLDSLETATNRNMLRKITWSTWQKNKFWGVSTTQIIEDFNKAYYINISSKTGCHNVFLQVLATTGIPGIIMHVVLWGLSLLYVIEYLIKGKDHTLKSIAWITLCIFPAIFIDNLYETYLYTSVTLMAMLGFLTFAIGAQLHERIRNEKN